MQEQITEDLLPFTTVTKTQLNEIAQDPHNACHLLVTFCITHNTLSFGPASFHQDIRALAVANGIQEVLTQTPLPDMQFIVTMRDSLDSTTFPIPVFAFAKDTHLSTNIVLMPDFEALSSHKNLLKQVEKGNKKYPWHKKRPQAFWRGVTTGGTVTKENFLQLPRSQAVTASLQNPHLIDARFTGLVQCPEIEETKNAYAAYFSNPLSIVEHFRYKYQLLIDGNTCAYARAYWQLFSNCVILKQNSSAIQWYYRCLKPFVHYIPVQEDLSDLVTQVTWAIAHDQQCQEISSCARAFANTNITQKAILQYLQLLLLEYAKLYQSN